MSSLEEHEAEQAAITAMCEAGTCRHPECHEEDETERQLGEALDILSLLRDGSMSAEMANRVDRLLNGEYRDEADQHQAEIVSRSAPRWAWELIDETLGADAHSKAFDKDLRASIGRALAAMGLACERASDEPIFEDDPDLEEAP